MNHRGGPPRLAVLSVLLAAVFLSPQWPLFAVDLPPGVALLQTRVRLSASVPVLPANTARYFHAGYATPVGAIDVYLTEVVPTSGIPPADTAEPVIPTCTRVAILRHDGVHNGVLEVRSQPGSPDTGNTGNTGNTADTPGAPDTGRYRIFLVPPERSVAEHPDDVFSFAAEFVAAFSFFLDADIDRAQALSFSGNRAPEFPAVLELNN